MTLHFKEDRNNLLQPGRKKRQGDFANFFFTKEMLIVNEGGTDRGYCFLFINTRNKI